MTGDIVLIALFIILIFLGAIIVIVIIDYITASSNFIKKSLMKKNQQYCINCKYKNKTPFDDDILWCSCLSLPIDGVTGKQKKALCAFNYGAFRRCKWEPRD